MLMQAIEPHVVIIGHGTFVMGATADDKFATAQERPAHPVTFARPFMLGRYPVTFDQWDAYVDAVPDAYRPPDSIAGRGDIPVMGVSHDDVRLYLAWLRDATGRPFRLPSEAEWEYACRAGTTTVFPTGDTITLDDANFFYDEQGNCIGLGRPTPVGRYPPNPWGLHDMLGNVNEHVEDAWCDNYHGAPTNGIASLDAAQPHRVLRGGAWDYMPRLLRCAYRDKLHRQTRLDNTGFRVACDLDGG